MTASNFSRKLTPYYCCLWPGPSHVPTCGSLLHWRLIATEPSTLFHCSFVIICVLLWCSTDVVILHIPTQIWVLKIRFVRPAKTQISLRIRAVWSESSLLAYAFYSLRAIQRGINKKPCHTGWMYRLICVFAGHTGLIVGFILLAHL